MKYTPLIAFIVIAAALTGCMGLSEVRKADAGDHSALGAHAMTPYGSGDAWRVNPATNQDVKITRPDGTVIEIKSH